ncbi:MAG: crossover junction endodeoxyribonuclease RuvC [Elusimicrobiota bacterium]
MIVLGIDPGWGRCGWAKIRAGDRESARAGDGKPELLKLGLISTEPGKPKAERLAELFGQIERLIRQNPKPDSMAIEEVHLPPQGIRISNLLGLGEARGVILLAAGRAGLGLAEIHPLAVKTTITGSSRSRKEDVARFLKFLLKGVEAKGVDDTTDAIAIALTAILTKRNFR